jgi:phage terminase large subunit-like protein
VFKDKLDLFRDIRDGVLVDPKKFGMLYEWPKAMLESEAYLKPENFYVTNPNMGRSVDAEWLKDKLDEALRGDGDGKQVFLAKHLNVEIGTRLRRDRWAGADYWDGAAFEPLRSLDELLSRSEVAVVGADGGGLDDLSGVCVLGRDKRTKIWLYWFHAYAHRKVLKLRQEIAPALLGFEQDGDLTLWGDGEAQECVATRLLEDGTQTEFLSRSEGEVDADIVGIVGVCRRGRDAHLMPEALGIGVDPAAIGQLLDALIAADFAVSDGAKGDVLGISQGAASMKSAIETMARKLQAGTAAHGGAKLMTWCVGNAKAEQRGNAVAITKQSSGKAKIDPLIAGFNATKLMERNPAAVGASVYQSRGVRRV